jgi:hypothetical protein
MAEIRSSGEIKTQLVDKLRRILYSVKKVDL